MSPHKYELELKTRAEALAKPPVIYSTIHEDLKWLTFIVGSETYAVEVEHVIEVFPFKEFTPIPNAPPHLLGVINLRRRILPLIDLKTLFNLHSSLSTQIIVLTHKGMETGITIDAAVDVQVIDTKTATPTLPTLTGLLSLYVKGITKERTIILDVERLLSKELIHAST